MSGSQIQPLDCRGVSPDAKAATRLTANSSVPTNSTTALCRSRDRRGRRDDRHPAAQAEEAAADQVREVHREQLRAGLGQERAEREQRAADGERGAGDDAVADHAATRWGHEGE